MTQSSERSVIDAMRDQIRTTAMPARRRFARVQRSDIVSSLPFVVAVAVALAVAVFGLTAFRHDHTPSPLSGVPAGVETSRQQLLHVLGVLRRPQTKADLDRRILQLDGQYEAPPQPLTPDLKRLLARWGYPRIDRPLVRVLKLPAWDAKLAIEPTSYEPSPASARRSVGLDLSLWIGSAPRIPPSTLVGTGPRPTSVGALLAHGLALTTVGPGKDVLAGVLVVPDGVARVTLTAIRFVKSPRAAVHPGDFGTASVVVHDNVGPFELMIPTVTERDVLSIMTAGFGAVARATWFDSTGRVIRVTTTSFDLFVTVRRQR